MREIKFRAWDKEAKHMRQVLSLHLRNEGCFSGLHARTVNGDNMFRAENVDLMQFTGLKDKDDEDVYEGDICVFWKDGPCAARMVVVWGDGAFILKGTDGKVINLLSFCQVKEFEIQRVGNIYEDSGLLSV
jgi:uncharacterized phage protein (TIGR01671 family)